MAVRGASVVVAVMVANLASAEPTPRGVDIKAYKDKLIVLKDADGGIYAVVNEHGAEPHVFFGDTSKVLHEQILEGARGRDGDGWNIAIVAPRTTYPFMGQIIRRKDGSFMRSCGEKLQAELTQLGGTQAKDVIEKAQFLTTSMMRRAYLLARDDRGVYYYVDVLRDVYGGNGHRVFVGKKGAMKQMALTDVTSDTAGDVFATKSGDLRLVRTIVDAKEKATAHWIRGERKNELVYLDVYMNQPLIYRELGLYKIPGTVCGNI